MKAGIEKRIHQLIQEIYNRRYTRKTPLAAEFTADRKPIPYDLIDYSRFQPIEHGMKWGNLWDSSWFRFTGRIPEEYEGREAVALIDIGAEGCLWKSGSPYWGITYKLTDEVFERKRRIPLFDEAPPGSEVDLLVEGAANGLFGAPHGMGEEVHNFCVLNQAELAVFDRQCWNLAMDMDYLLQLYQSLDPRDVRARRILRGLNSIADLAPVFDHLPEAAARAAELLQPPAVPSELTAWSVGHAHIDLGWLWPYRETVRKGGRTFATALRMLERYPEYIFGCSQPQLLDWVKEAYPGVYSEIKDAEEAGRIECQGAMWVEPDVNIPGGESLVRQCLYGKEFFRREFGRDIRFLWLPDAFGYSAALPQILKRSGVDYFITQKISWNEANTFPHHTFRWRGIDGSAVTAHFPPADTYNCTNEPEVLRGAARRFAQGDIHDGFLNLYGIGDGGGGPSRRHIEWGLRGQNCEGAVKVKFAPAEEFLRYLDRQDPGEMPEWDGELYLELHRGTYTTCGKIKRYNRLLEHRLRDAELFASVLTAVSGEAYPQEEIRGIWKETLLNQFHDVITGTSIAEVYQDAYRISEKNLKALETIEQSLAEQLWEQECADTVTVVNTQPWERQELVQIGDIRGFAEVPSMGFRQYRKSELTALFQEQIGEVSWQEDAGILENRRISAVLAPDGSISSLRLKESDRELFGPGGGGKFLLYEDKPYAWDAWDVSSYYQQTVPKQADLLSRRTVLSDPQCVQIEQVFQTGSSRITQVLELRSGEYLLRSTCRVLWQEQRSMLRLSAEVSVRSFGAWYEIQFGALERPTHQNTSWDEAKFEVCGHRFADISQPDYGIALINDCKYGYRIHRGTMELNLLRSPQYPDATVDIGEHVFSFAYMPHQGTWREAGVVRQAHNFQSPLKVFSRKTAGRRTELSWFAPDARAVKLETVKPAEKGTGIILRLYETEGTSCRCRLSSSFSFGEAAEVNLMEEHIGALPLTEAGEIELAFTPFEIKTLFVRMQ